MPKVNESGYTAADFIEGLEALKKLGAEHMAEYDSAYVRERLGISAPNFSAIKNGRIRTTALHIWALRGLYLNAKYQYAGKQARAENGAD